jgi:predicted nucleotidyltransferase component of viral defense system
MARVTPRWECAEPELVTAYCLISTILSDTDFYLAGGTALALQEGHRISVDLDFMSATFSEPENLIQDVQAADLEFEVTMTSSRTVYITTGGVQVSFFGYDYPQLEEVVECGEGLLPLAHTDDIAAMKLAAVASRGSRKDFVDLWLLISRHRSLEAYLELFKTKYRMRDIGHVIRSLRYFDDADEEPELRMLIDLDWNRVKSDFLTWVSSLLPS